MGIRHQSDRDGRRHDSGKHPSFGLRPFLGALALLRGHRPATRVVHVTTSRTSNRRTQRASSPARPSIGYSRRSRRNLSDFDRRTQMPHSLAVCASSSWRVRMKLRPRTVPITCCHSRWTPSPGTMPENRRRSGDHNICKQDSRTGSATRHQTNMVVVSPTKMLAALLIKLEVCL